MTLCRIGDSDGKYIEVNFPDTVAEVSLSQKIAFDTAQEQMLAWLSTSAENNTLDKNITYYLYLLSRCISEFFDVDMSEILEIDISDYLDDEGNLKAEILVGDMSYDYTDEQKEEWKEVDNTLSMIYHRIMTLLSSYEFSYRTDTDYLFNYKGVWYAIPHLISESFDSKTFSKITVQQAVETLQVKKYLAEQKFEDIETSKSVRFTAFLKIVALLVRKDRGEEVPLEEAPFTTFIQKRMETFQELDMETAYDIIFFSIISTAISKKTAKTSDFSNLLKSLVQEAPKQT